MGVLSGDRRNAIMIIAPREVNPMLKLIPWLLSISLVFTVSPKAVLADDDILKDIGIGAAGNVVTGAILGNGSPLGNVVKGAASGAAVNGTHREDDNSVTGKIQDGVVGAAASTVTGEIIDNGSAAKNAVGGAVSGMLINIFK